MAVSYSCVVVDPSGLVVVVVVVVVVCVEGTAGCGPAGGGALGSITASVGPTCEAGLTLGTTSVGDTGRIVTFSAAGAGTPTPSGSVCDSIEFGLPAGRLLIYVWAWVCVSEAGGASAPLDEALVPL